MLAAMGGCDAGGAELSGLGPKAASLERVNLVKNANFTGQPNLTHWYTIKGLDWSSPTPCGGLISDHSYKAGKVYRDGAFVDDPECSLYQYVDIRDIETDLRSKPLVLQADLTLLDEALDEEPPPSYQALVGFKQEMTNGHLRHLFDLVTHDSGQGINRKVIKPEHWPTEPVTHLLVVFKLRRATVNNVVLGRVGAPLSARTRVLKTGFSTHPDDDCTGLMEHCHGSPMRPIGYVVSDAAFCLNCKPLYTAYSSGYNDTCAGLGTSYCHGGNTIDSWGDLIGYIHQDKRDCEAFYGVDACGALYHRYSDHDTDTCTGLAGHMCDNAAVDHGSWIGYVGLYNPPYPIPSISDERVALESVHIRMTASAEPGDYLTARDCDPGYDRSRYVDVAPLDTGSSKPRWNIEPVPLPLLKRHADWDNYFSPTGGGHYRQTYRIRSLREGDACVKDAQYLAILSNWALDRLRGGAILNSALLSADDSSGRHWWIAEDTADGTGTIRLRNVATRDLLDASAISVSFNWGVIWHVGQTTADDDSGERWKVFAPGGGERWLVASPPDGLLPIDGLGGYWQPLHACHGCSSNEYELTTGVTQGVEHIESKTVSRSIAVELSVEYGFTSSAVSFSQGWEWHQSISRTFLTHQQESHTLICDKGGLWQWRTSVEVPCLEGMCAVVAKSSYYYCSDEAPQDPLFEHCSGSEPCPLGGEYDGAKCRLADAPPGAHAYVKDNTPYYTLPDDGECETWAEFEDNQHTCFVDLKHEDLGENKRIKVDLPEEAMHKLELSAWDNAWFVKACETSD